MDTRDIRTLSFELFLSTFFLFFLFLVSLTIFSLLLPFLRFNLFIPFFDHEQIHKKKNITEENCQNIDWLKWVYFQFILIQHFSQCAGMLNEKKKKRKLRKAFYVFRRNKNIWAFLEHEKKYIYLFLQKVFFFVRFFFFSITNDITYPFRFF